jgi:hypothetical protein
MAAADDWTDDDFIERTRVVEASTPEARYEFLLRIIRYYLSRGASFTQIEEELVAAGLPPGPVEQIVELVIQDLQGRRRPLGAYPWVDVTPAVIAAMGFDVRDLSGAPPDKTEPDPLPALSFANPTDAVAGAMARARGASRTHAVGCALFAAFCAGVVILTLIFGLAR